MNKKKFSNYIKAFDFKKLFIDLGWDNYSNKIPLGVDDEVFKLSGLVEKRGFVIALCQPAENGDIPLYTSRKKIENQFSKLHQEHLIIYENKSKTKQIWQFVIHEKDKPKRVHEIPYNIEKDPEILYQRARGLLFTLDEEENITLVDVIARFKEGFGKNTEQVTKRFYDEFKKHHTSFLDFIEGIDDVIKIQDNKNKQWYASLMLSRLMFCYFIQKRGYLDNDLNYLQNKLKEVKQKEGRNIFYSFYRDFLLQLFHQGLGQPQKARSLTVDIGNIPYLDGGLFDVHVLERQFEEIKIQDDAFERIFNFFDQWNWHLDTSIEATGRDINPDVIGYIFEKYINDRAAMGAYYTKEDITDYIGKNTIIPFLFDRVKKEYPKAFKHDAYLWTFLRESGDTYIYDAVKKGIYEAASGDTPQKIEDMTIPENIAIGLDTLKPELLERRRDWNTKTPDEFALPTEIWRETIARWKRYFEVRNKIISGEITEINDFITYNLNIRQFIQDVLEGTDDPDFLLHFYKSIAGDKKTRKPITILDPTCGSGAFLFAALNILEPLYEACIERMEQFTAEEPRRYKFFHEVLAEVNSEEHPNLRYYICKTIILNNLYGVDIMHEAVEIAKLRLFLKMVGAVDMNLRKPNFGLEPLPDIDFNIRAGNTLVGFATEKEFRNAVETREPLFAPKIIEGFEDEFGITATAFKRFQNAQLITNKGEETHKKAKEELQDRLDTLNEKLNVYLASTYGIDKNKIPDEKRFEKKYEEWRSSHQPFHWFAEFYEIINGNGGFDVVIGNPPYVAMTKIDYGIICNNFTTTDLYGYVINRAFSILNSKGRHGFIVMHNLAFSSGFKDVRSVIRKNASTSWLSFYARIPAGLFSGDVRVRNCIYLIDKAKKEKVLSFTTRIHRWFAESRPYLMEKLKYVSFTSVDEFPMFNDKELSLFFSNMQGTSLQMFSTRSSSNILYYKQSAYNWIAVSLKPAPCYSGNGKQVPQSQVKSLPIIDKDICNCILLLFNGKLCFSHWLSFGDEFHVTKDDLLSMKLPISKFSEQDKKALYNLAKEFTDRLDDTIQFKLNAGKKVGTYNTSRLWEITDKSDSIFLKYMCDNPNEVQEAIENHVYSTVLTQDGQAEDEE